VRGEALTRRVLCAAISDGGGTIVLKPGVYEEPLLLENGEKIVSLRSARVRSHSSTSNPLQLISGSGTVVIFS
jgi:hypothetical protein